MNPLNPSIRRADHGAGLVCASVVLGLARTLHAQRAGHGSGTVVRTHHASTGTAAMSPLSAH